MKELTIQEKAKAYDKVREKIALRFGSNVAEEIFSEFEESEDEKIRKELITHCRNTKCVTEEGAERIAKWIAWLEKQNSNIDNANKEYWRGYREGKKEILDKYAELEKPGKHLENFDEAEKEKSDFVGDGFIECHANFLDFKEGNTYWLEYIGDDKYNVRSDNLLGKTYHITPCQLYTIFKKLTWLEQKPAEKAEPKFKVGDWVVVSNVIYHIDKISGVYLTLSTLDGTALVYHISVLDSEHTHLYSIRDAKDGDVLAFDDETIVIFKDLYNATTFHSYCYIEEGRFSSQDDMPSWWEGKGFYPATKEQRNKFERAMADAGWEFDFNKKELKRIEDDPDPENFKLQLMSELCDLVKDYIQQKSSKWSEDDEWMLNEAINAVTVSDYAEGRKEMCIGWLKSLPLRPQNKWKPTEEQTDALEHFVRSIGESGYASPYDNNTKSLYSLLEQLKKLREE